MKHLLGIFHRAGSSDDFHELVVVVWYWFKLLQKMFKFIWKSFPVDFPKIKARRFGTDTVETVEVTVIPIGQCWLPWKKFENQFFTEWMWSNAVAHKSNIGIVSTFPMFAVKRFWELCIVHETELASAQASASPSKLDSLYPQFML